MSQFTDAPPATGDRQGVWKRARSVCNQLACAYPHLRFASFLCQSYRNPALVAKLAANLHLLTGGRFILGIGAGWKKDEYAAYGYDFPSLSVRSVQLEEAVQIVRRLWTGTRVTFTGDYYYIRDAYCVPRPEPPPPLVIGGGSEGVLRVCAQYADWWNYVGGTLEAFADKLSVLRAHCDAIGRDSGEILKTWASSVVIAETEDEVQRLAEEMPGGIIKGTPDQVVEQLKPFVQQGMQYFMPAFRDFPRTAGIKLFADAVIPYL